MLFLNGKVVSLDKTEERVYLDGKEVIPNQGNFNLDGKNYSFKKLLVMQYGGINFTDDFVDEMEVQPLETGPKKNRRITFIPKFKTPIEPIEGYRISPLYPRYIVNKEGRVLRRTTLRELNFSPVGPNITYPIAKISGVASDGKVQSAAMHRIVASAWCPNDDFVERPYVNHIDGDKTNFHADNLEWVTETENNDHAIETGLNDSPVEITLRDYETQEVFPFRSITKCAEFLDVKPAIVHNYILQSEHKYLLCRKYDVKTEDYGWFFESKVPLITPKRNLIIVHHQDGSQKEFYDVYSVFKHYGIWNVLYSVENIKKFVLKLPDVKNIEFFMTETKTGILSKNLDTGEVLEHESMRSASRSLGLTFTIIRARIKRKESGRPANGYLFKLNDDSEWLPIEEKDVIKQVKIKNHKTGEEIIYPSVRETSRKLKLDRTTIKGRIERKSVIDHLEISYV